MVDLSFGALGTIVFLEIISSSQERGIYRISRAQNPLWQEMEIFTIKFLVSYVNQTLDPDLSHTE